MKHRVFSTLIIGVVLAAGHSAEAGFPTTDSSGLDEQQGLRCRRLQRAVQTVVATEGYGSARLANGTASVRRPRKAVRDVIGYSVKRRTVGRGCFHCISRQIRRRVPLSEQAACGTHDLCVEGESLKRSSNDCVARVCDQDRSCCRGHWDASCVTRATALCGDTCETCTHDVCEAGAALDASCGECAEKICGIDPFCCDTLWGEDCVAKVETVCGDSCTAPAPSTSTTSLPPTTSTLPTTTTTLDDVTTTSSSTTTLDAATTTTTSSTLEPDGNCVDAIDFDDDIAAFGWKPLMPRQLRTGQRDSDVRIAVRGCARRGPGWLPRR